jgi:hypothetical protein
MPTTDPTAGYASTIKSTYRRRPDTDAEFPVSAHTQHIGLLQKVQWHPLNAIGMLAVLVVVVVLGHPRSRWCPGCSQTWQRNGRPLNMYLVLESVP